VAPNLQEISDLTGLPISGSPYDERDFSLVDVIYRPENGIHELHRCLRHVYHIYWYLLAGRESLTLAEWIDHFTSVVRLKSGQFADVFDLFDDAIPSTKRSRIKQNHCNLCKMD
jgi:hypothetical protein